MISRIPITRYHQLSDLDDAEMTEGYRSGLDGDPEPGDNRSYAFWHGWRNGAVDGGYREKDDAQAELAHDWARTDMKKCSRYFPKVEGEGER